MSNYGKTALKGIFMASKRGDEAGSVPKVGLSIVRRPAPGLVSLLLGKRGESEAIQPLLTLLHSVECSAIGG